MEGGRLMKKFLYQRDYECNIHYTTINKYDITSRHHLEFKIQISTLDSMFLASFHSTVLINNVRLNCRIKIYLKTNNAFMLQSTHKKANLRMKYVLCSVRKGNTNNMMEKKLLCEICT